MRAANIFLKIANINIRSNNNLSYREVLILINIYINIILYNIYYTRMFFYPNFIHGRRCSPHPILGSVYHLGGGYDEA